MTLGLALLCAPACDEGDDGGDDVLDGDTTGDGDGDATGDGDGDSGGDKGDSGDTGELMGCAAIASEAECVAEAGCGPVRGNMLVEDGEGSWCTDAEEEFIGCASSGELCPMLTKTLCDGENVWRTTGCVPGNLSACEAPGEVSGPCI